MCSKYIMIDHITKRSLLLIINFGIFVIFKKILLYTYLLLLSLKLVSNKVIIFHHIKRKWIEKEEERKREIKEEESKENGRVGLDVESVRYRRIRLCGFFPHSKPSS